MAQNILLLDHDDRRRASISHQFACLDLHIEPFDSIAELEAHWPAHGVILIFDDGDLVLNLTDMMIRIGKWMPFICYSENTTVDQIVTAVRRGAANYIAWPFTVHALQTAVASANDENHGFARLKAREASARRKINRLTEREKEILEAVAAGLSNRRIGEKLKISPRTVEIHRANLLTKMDCNHSSQAIRVAVEAAMIQEI